MKKDYLFSLHPEGWVKTKYIKCFWRYTDPGKYHNKTVALIDGQTFILDSKYSDTEEQLLKYSDNV